MTFHRFCKAALFAVTLAGCSGVLGADVHENTLVIEQSIGTVPGVPVQITTLPPYTFAFDVPSTPFTSTTSSGGSNGFSLQSSMTLNGASLNLTSGNGDLSGIQSMQLTVTKNGVTSTLATYTKSAANPTPASVVLTPAVDANGKPVELLDQVDANHRLNLTLTASGSLPRQNWTAAADFDVRISTSANYP